MKRTCYVLALLSARHLVKKGCAVTYLFPSRLIIRSLISSGCLTDLLPKEKSGTTLVEHGMDHIPDKRLRYQQSVGHAGQGKPYRRRTGTIQGFDHKRLWKHNPGGRS